MGYTNRGGYPMHVEPLRIQFVRKGVRGPNDLDVTAVRRELRTEKSIEEIADGMGVCSDTLRKFIRRRNICDLTERRKFITLQKSLDKVGTVDTR